MISFRLANVLAFTCKDMRVTPHIPYHAAPGRGASRFCYDSRGFARCNVGLACVQRIREGWLLRGEPSSWHKTERFARSLDLAFNPLVVPAGVV